jgi:tetratricopeptide (TPR) repeat protein
MDMAATQQDFSPAALAQLWQILESDPASTRFQADALAGSMPENPEIALLRAAARRRLGDIQGAHIVLRPFMAKPARAPIAWFEWGMILTEMEDEPGAVAALERAVLLDAAFSGAWRALGDLHMVLGAGVAAGEAYACAARAESRDPRLAASVAALTDGRPEVAERLLKAHVRQFPADVRAHRLLAEAAIRLGRAAEAEAVLEQVLRMAPGFAAARHTLAVLFYARRKFGAALPHIKHLLGLVPHQPSLRAMLGACCVETGDLAAAVPIYQQMIATFRNRPKVWLFYGHALQTLGREQDAARAYRVCLELAPRWPGGVYLSLADLKTTPFADTEIAAMRGALGDAATTGADAAQLHYALGRALEQRADYAQAFDHFAQAARLRRAEISYHADRTSEFVAAAQSVFTPEFFAARRAGGDPSSAPIFIVGLPRSGSTLVEQILASHKQVEGTAELREIGEIAAELRGKRPAADLPAIIAGLDAATLTRLGERYLNNTRQVRRDGRAHFTDKMPDNFLHIGLIQLILPRARIIDVRRGAMASGLAAFKQYFQAKQTGQDYTYDLTEIGRYYRDYVALMAHFEKMLPGHVYRLRYEDLVRDTEAQVRALLDYCALPFDPACLRFWQTPRAVQTPSAQQVRRPIFREGLDHWRHYEPWLAPLRESLGTLADA